MPLTRFQQTMRGIAVWLITITGVSHSASAVELKDFLALTSPAPTQEIRYGTAPSQGI